MRWYRDDCRRQNEGWWKLLSVLGILLGLAMTVISVLECRKAKAYRDALIDLSDQFPEEDAEARRTAWRSSHAPANRATVQERLEHQRVEEEA